MPRPERRCTERAKLTGGAQVEGRLAASGPWIWQGTDAPWTRRDRSPTAAPRRLPPTAATAAHGRSAQTWISRHPLGRHPPRLGAGEDERSLPVGPPPEQGRNVVQRIIWRESQAMRDQRMLEDRAQGRRRWEREGPQPALGRARAHRFHPSPGVLVHGLDHRERAELGRAHHQAQPAEVPAVPPVADQPARISATGRGGCGRRGGGWRSGGLSARTARAAAVSWPRLPR